MSETKNWQVLLVDDDPDIGLTIEGLLEGEEIPDEGRGMHISVTSLTNFDEALGLLQTRRFDLLILDVRRGSYDGYRENEAGVLTLQAIKQKCFVPVIFYTGLPDTVRNLETPFIRVVEKTDVSGLPEVVKEIFATGLPRINRALMRLLETLQRDYMWEFAAEHWQEFSGSSDHSVLAYLLARRLAQSLSLSGPGIKQLFEDLDDPDGVVTNISRVHPGRYYILPPVMPSFLAGDLYIEQTEGEPHRYLLLLTPSCDLYTDRARPMKAEQILLARCKLLSELEEYRQWENSQPSPSSGVKNALLGKIEIKNERYYFLPKAITIPNLVVDFQQLVTMTIEQFTNLRRVASLDSPFAEAVQARFSRYFGRLGTPDLDINKVFPGLKRYEDESI